MKYAKLSGILLIACLGGYQLWVMTTPSPEQIISESIRKSNVEINIRNTAKVEEYKQYLAGCQSTASGSNTEILEQLSTCINRPKPELEKLIQIPDYGNSGSVQKMSKNNVEESTTTASVIAVPPSNSGSKSNKVIREDYQKTPDETVCSDYQIKKVKMVVIHNTATDSNIPATTIENGHKNRWKLTTYTSAYHYLIENNGNIIRARSEKCGSLALSNKATLPNDETINISYIGNSKPTEKQLDSLVRLTRDIQNRYGLPRDSVTAHADIQSKNHNESMEGMFGSKANFVKLIRLRDTVSIYGKQSSELTYMWHAWGDKDFIGTIFQESRMNNATVGDGGQSIGYCQIHKGYQPLWYAEYSKLQTMEARLNYCHEKYIYSSSLKGGVGSGFHGWNKRINHISNFLIK